MVIECISSKRNEIKKCAVHVSPRPASLGKALGLLTRRLCSLEKNVLGIQYMGVSEKKGVPFFGVFTKRILLFGVLY